jgi:hypothetical protein
MQSSRPGARTHMLGPDPASALTLMQSLCPAPLHSRPATADRQHEGVGGSASESEQVSGSIPRQDKPSLRTSGTRRMLGVTSPSGSPA